MHAVDVDGRIWHLRVRVDRFDVDVHVGAKRTVARDGLRGASLEQRKVAAHGRTRDQSRRQACPAETTDGLQVVLTRTTCKLGSSSRSCHHIRCSRCCRARPPCLSQSARGLGVSACQPVQSNRRLKCSVIASSLTGAVGVPPGWWIEHIAVGGGQRRHCQDSSKAQHHCCSFGAAQGCWKARAVATTAAAACATPGTEGQLSFCPERVGNEKAETRATMIERSCVAF